MKIRMNMILKSDTLPGSGEGLAGIIDTDINYDEWGIPYIPGKRIKGILRESALELEDAGRQSKMKILDNSIESIFGKPGEEKGTSLKISDGRIGNDELLKKLMQYTGNQQVLSAVFNRETVLDHFTYLRSQTAVDNDGVARKNSLRTSRVLKKGLCFRFDIQLPDRFKDDFEKICNITRRFGIARTRGLGEIKLTTEAVINDEINQKLLRGVQGGGFLEKSPPGLRRKKKTWRITIYIENTGQLLVSKQMGKNQWGETYIPGSTILGALAGMFIKNKNLKNPHQCEVFRELFIDGSVCFTNAYPVNREDDIHYPSPLSLFKEKDRETYLDLAREDHWEQVVHGNKETKGHPRGFAYLEVDQDTLSVEIMNVETEMEYHHSRPADKSIGHAREAQGEFFQFSVIKAGQSFKSHITGEFEHLERIKQLLEQSPVVYLGKSGTAQYGKCIVKIVEFQEAKEGEDTWENGESIVITLAADMILLNDLGYMVPDPERIKIEIAQILEVDEKKLEIERSVLDFNRIGGFLNAWKMPKIQQTALKAGSTIVIRNNSGTGLPIDKLKNHSFGVNREQGYGQVHINWHGQEDSDIIVTSPAPKKIVSPGKDECAGLKDFVKDILMKRIKSMLSADAVERVKKVKKLPSSSFLGKIISFLDQAKTFEDFIELISQLRSRGKDQLEIIEKDLKIKNKSIDKKEVENFITQKYNDILTDPDAAENLLRTTGLERGFFKEKSNLFTLYQSFAMFFLNQLKLKKRRENE